MSIKRIRRDKNTPPESSKRGKQVYASGEIPHLWFHKTQASARNAKQSLYFENETIFSYGGHFPIAMHVTNESGKCAVLFTTRTHSITTSGHCSAVLSAIPDSTLIFHVPVVRVSDKWGRIDDEHITNLADYVTRINEDITSSARARSAWKKECRHVDAVKLVTEAKAYAKFFGMPAPTLPNVPALDSKEMQAIRDRESKNSAKRAEQTRLEKIQRQKEEAERAEKWRNGEYVGSLYNTPVMLRLTNTVEQELDEPIGMIVQTSRGASVPVAHALRGLRFVRAVVAKGIPYVRNGHTLRLGHYPIDRIDADGTLHAGCHVIPYSEIERIAPALETFNIAPAPIEENAGCDKCGMSDRVADSKFCEYCQQSEA